MITFKPKRFILKSWKANLEDNIQMKVRLQSLILPKNYQNIKWANLSSKGKEIYWKKRNNTTWELIMPILTILRIFNNNWENGKLSTIKGKSFGEKELLIRSILWKIYKKRHLKPRNNSFRLLISSKIEILRWIKLARSMDSYQVKDKRIFLSSSSQAMKQLQKTMSTQRDCFKRSTSFSKSYFKNRRIFINSRQHWRK